VSQSKYIGNWNANVSHAVLSRDWFLCLAFSSLVRARPQEPFRSTGNVEDVLCFAFTFSGVELRLLQTELGEFEVPTVGFDTRHRPMRQKWLIRS